MDFAAAVNAELRDLKAAGADVSSSTSLGWRPGREARRRPRRRSTAPSTASPDRPPCISASATPIVARQAEQLLVFSELAATVAQQISIEAAQPDLDLGNLDELGRKTIIFGVISMGDPEPEAAEIVAARIRAALATCRRSGWSRPRIAA